MNKYEFEIQVYEIIIVEGEDAEEARMKLVNGEVDNISLGRPDACISDGRLLEENLMRENNGEKNDRN